MKILFLARLFYPDIGGVEKHVLEISKVLINKGHEVSVITESSGKQNEINGIKIFRIKNLPNSWFKKFYIWKWMISNLSIFKEADIIHVHDIYYSYLPIKLLLLSKKSFITFHGYESYPISKKNILIRKISEKLASGNIIVGDFIKKWYGTTPNYVIYGATELPSVTNKPKNKVTGIFIGRLDYHTGIGDYAKAVEIIREKYPKFKFTIIGEGPFKKKVSRYKPLGAKKDAVKYLKDNNFAFVSRYLSILEAFAHKRLVIALYDNPVKKDYLGMVPYSKFIVLEESPEKIAEKVIHYMKNPNESEILVEKAYEWVKDKNWESIVNIYLKLWKK